MIVALPAVAFIVAACSSDVVERAQFRGELREQRARAEQLCQERGGVEIVQPIPDRMDVLTVFTNAGEYRVVRGPGDPNLGGTTTYALMTPVAREEMARLTRSWDVSAFITATHYLSTARVAAVDLLLEDFQHHDNAILGRMLHDGRLLPERHLPNGMFRYEILPSDHPSCGAFNAMLAAFAEQGFSYAYAPSNEFYSALSRNRECIAVSYIGPKDAYTPPGYIYHTYNDDLPGESVRQVIDELIAPNGDIVARLRNFTAGTRTGHCADGTSNILEHFVYR